MKYSQNDEQLYVQDHFESVKPGRFLEIGAYHPKTFSNTRWLVENGWGGVYVEPATDLVKTFRDEYAERDDIIIEQCAIGAFDGTVTFHDSNGDAIGTTVESHKNKWEKGYNCKFTPTTVDQLTVESLLAKHPGTFEVVNIDTEGNTLEIFEQFDLNAVGCQMCIVEHNGEDMQRFINHANKYGMIELHRNGENFIFITI